MAEYQTAFHRRHEFESADGRRWHTYRSACMAILNPEYRDVRHFVDLQSGVIYTSEDAISFILQPRAGVRYTLTQAQEKLFD